MCNVVGVVHLLAQESPRDRLDQVAEIALIVLKYGLIAAAAFAAFALFTGLLVKAGLVIGPISFIAAFVGWIIYGWTDTSDIYIGSLIGLGVLSLIAFFND